LDLLGVRVPLLGGVTRVGVRSDDVRQVTGRNDNFLECRRKYLSFQSCWATMALVGFAALALRSI
jgi:hypothetical protein